MSNFNITIKGGKLYNTDNIILNYQSVEKQAYTEKLIGEIIYQEQKRHISDLDLEKSINKIFSNNTSKNKNDDNAAINKKSQLKAQLKHAINKKFKRGDFICLRTKGKGGAKRIERIYQIKQIVWTMNDIVLKALVVKQISGPNYNMFTLNRNDCARVHVKYEPGLQFLSMELPWLPVKLSQKYNKILTK